MQSFCLLVLLLATNGVFCMHVDDSIFQEDQQNESSEDSTQEMEDLFSSKKENDWWSKETFKKHGWSDDAPDVEAAPIDKVVSASLYRHEKYHMYISQRGDLVTKEIKKLRETELSGVLKEMDHEAKKRGIRAKVFIYAKKAREEDLKTINMIKGMSLVQKRKKHRRHRFSPYSRDLSDKVDNMHID